ncbi:MAG: sigma-54 dependent transcriptional regulator [Deltaproteobacteria bacterium]|nr:sigma-54 dependent transcriptional regulator [Deltaproteobacteria bacterium]
MPEQRNDDSVGKIAAHLASERESYVLVFSAGTTKRVPLPAQGRISFRKAADGRVDAAEEPCDAPLFRIVSTHGETGLEVSADGGEIQVNGEAVTGARSLISGDVITAGATILVLYRALQDVADRLVMDMPDLLHRMRQEIDRSLRYGRPLSVLVVRTGAVGGDDHARIRAAATGAIRFVDVIGWDVSGEMVVLFPETADSADIPARRVLDALLPIAPAARAGLSRCPEDGSDLDALLAGARHAAGGAASGSIASVRESAASFELGGRAVIVVDPKMRRLFELARDLARSEMPVLVTGETGSGKDAVASAIHAWSSRNAAPLVSINCAAVSESLLESELFGHERGAFTGAATARIGLLESAKGGTVFLDEVTESSPRTQAELLRVLETHRVRPVGSVRERDIDVRIVAATNRSVEAEIEAGRFRRDLFYRLGAATIAVPPLRERPLDVPALARAFLGEACLKAGREPMSISRMAMQRLELHDWPGNVRELRNLMDFVAASIRSDVLEAAELPDRISVRAAPWLVGKAPLASGAGVPGVAGGAPRRFRKLADEVRELERARIEEALLATDGVRARAAELIGMPQRTLVTKMKLYGLSAIPSSRRRLRDDG